LVGVAVNVKADPEQLGLDPEVIATATEGVTIAFLLIVIELEVAVADVAQAALDVNTQLTMSPFANAVLVNVALFVPALVPFTVH
jgi:hypothetical protein